MIYHLSVIIYSESHAGSGTTAFRTLPFFVLLYLCLAEFYNSPKMKFRRLRQMGFAVLLGASLVLASFAAPLCACLNPAANAGDCCDDMEDHCPMKTRQADSLDKNSHSGCDCFVEKRETPPAKISAKGSSQTAAFALTPNFHLFEFRIQTVSHQAFYIAKPFPEDPFLNQAFARGPPRL